MEVSIEPLEPDSSGSGFEGALALRHILTAEYDPALDPDTEVMFRADLVGTDIFEKQVLVASCGGEVVGIAGVWIHHLASNVDKAEAQIEVHPDHRRRGIGSALLGAVLDLAESKGRTSLAPANVNAEPAVRFWEAMGAEQKLVERLNRLWLVETDDALMRDWVASSAERARDYRLEHYRGATPPHLLSARVHLMTVMNDAPLDDLDWEPDVWTDDDIRQFDELMIGRGRELWTTIAFGPGDSPAGFTSVSTQYEKPRFAHQGDTAVDPAHRNRGIGRWLKADMWLRLRSEAPYVEAIDTENAASNDPMLAINVAMGFRPILEWSIWQADVSVLRARLAPR